MWLTCASAVSAPNEEFGPLIVIDLPAYRLWALQHGNGAEPPLEMRIVVGMVPKAETPLFVSQMRYLAFNPY